MPVLDGDATWGVTSSSDTSGGRRGLNQHPRQQGPTNATMAAPVVLLTSSLLSARDRSTANK